MWYFHFKFMGVIELFRNSDFISLGNHEELLFFRTRVIVFVVVVGVFSLFLMLVYWGPNM